MLRRLEVCYQRPPVAKELAVADDARKIVAVGAIIPLPLVLTDVGTTTVDALLFSPLVLTDPTPSTVDALVPLPFVLTDPTSTAVDALVMAAPVRAVDVCTVRVEAGPERVDVKLFSLPQFCAVSARPLFDQLDRHSVPANVVEVPVHWCCELVFRPGSVLLQPSHQRLGRRAHVDRAIAAVGQFVNFSVLIVQSGVSELWFVFFFRL